MGGRSSAVLAELNAGVEEAPAHNEPTDAPADREAPLDLQGYQRATPPEETPPADLFPDDMRPETSAATRIAVLRAIGIDGVLRIGVDEAGARRYSVVDSTTGEMLREWSERDYFRLVRGVREDVFDDIDAGLMVDDFLQSFL